MILFDFLIAFEEIRGKKKKKPRLSISSMPSGRCLIGHELILYAD